MSNGGFATVNENLRLQQVYATLLNFGGAELVDRIGLGGVTRGMQRWIYRVGEPIPALSAAVKTRVMLESLGPTYVKLGQIVSSQANVLPDDWRTQLDLLQNEVPPVPYEMARQVVIGELGAPPEELYASFSPRPLAAASLGQVHHAVLNDGTEAAVKVQRPNLDRQVQADLGVARLMGRYSERRSSWARQIGLRSMLDEFSSTLLEELDYYAEAHNMLTLAKNMEPIEGVHIPALYRELSGRRVLTQEFVRGVKISDVDAMRRAGLDVGKVGEAALRAAIKMLLIDGFFHADPHPGNLFVNTDTGVVTFLDCGMVGELTVAQRAHMVMLLWTFVAGDITAMAGQLRSLSVPFQPVDDKAFTHAFEHKMSRYDRGSKADVKAVLSSAMGVLRDHGLRLDPQLTLALKAMAQSSAFFTPLAPPDRPFTEAALEAVRDLAEQTFTEDFIVDAAKKQGIRLASQAAQEAPDYLKGLLSWRDQLKKGRLTIYLDTSAVDRQVEQLRGITATVTVALLVGAAMIASSAAALVFGQHGPHILARIAEAAFVASFGVAAVLVIGYLAQMHRRRRKD